MTRAISWAMECFLSADRKYESPPREITDAAAETTDEVLPGLFIGSISQCGSATKQGLRTVCVRHVPCHVPMCVHSPVLNLETWIASTEELERASAVIRELWLDGGNRTYVHCFHGVERAPLVMAWFIHSNIPAIRKLPSVRMTNPNISFQDVYKYVLRRRPVAQDRTLWLERIPGPLN